MTRLTEALKRSSWLALTALALLPVQSMGQAPGSITVNINSGDPAFPFPQFLEYEQGKTLAKHNSPGVTHFEMEKSIRDAYQIMMNRAAYSGESLNGTQYIKFNDMECNYGTFVSEGDGYALLAAAWMGDKETFDGLWLWMHDNRLSGVDRYLDCQPLRQDYEYGKWTFGWQNDATTGTGSTSNDAATDGDTDVALALLMAYRQWGDEMGIDDACGNPISYKHDAEEFITAFADTTYWDDGSGGISGLSGYMTGNIGLDGYVKNGNTWGEMTDWAANGNYNGMDLAFFINGPQSGYFDYHSPAYFHAFADFLEEVGGSPFAIEQYKRAEASSDWLMGQLNAQGLIPHAGDVSVNGTTASFSNVKPAEDFRLPLRTVTNYMWHGPPETTWNPVTHTYEPGTNTFELDNATTFAEFVRHPNNGCEKLGSDPTDVIYDGPSVLHSAYTVNGSPQDEHIIQWAPSSAAGSAVIDGDLDLAGDLYRNLEVEWDVCGEDIDGTVPETELCEYPPENAQRYLESKPKYFHGWFRLNGMLTLTGNLHSPMDMKPVSNMKVYLDVDKTSASTGDLITYDISYRNFGALNAEDVEVTFDIPAGMEFVSSSAGAHSGGTVTVDVGEIVGVKSDNVAQTVGDFQVTVRVTADSGTMKAQAEVTTSNGTGWVSNEYPNNCSATFEKNWVDIIEPSLEIWKEGSRTTVNPGDSVAYDVSFKNKSVPWLDGGRPDVRFTHSHNIQTDAIFYMFFRMLHGASESYINYGNYRVSYFLNQPSVKGVASGLGQPGWMLDNFLYEGGDFDDIGFATQNIPFGEDEHGAWDQRIIIKFADQLAGPVHHLYSQTSNDHRIHRGNNFPLKAWFALKDGTTSAIDWTDDWSYDPAWSVGGNDKEVFFPVTPDWTDPDNPGTHVDKWHVDECRTATESVSRILVEEFDGYTWRRAFGDGPLPGREQENVVVTDTLPEELEWGGFINPTALGVDATYDPATRVITWTVPAMLVEDSAGFSYFAYAKSEEDLGGCPIDIEAHNTAWIGSDTDSPVGDDHTVAITCDELPPEPPKETTFYKLANKDLVAIGDDITYTLAYVNTHGTIAEPDMSTNTNWTAHGGTTLPPNFTGDIPWASKPKLFTHDYSHGTNGEFYLTIDHDNWTDMALLFRHQGGHPKDGDLQGVMLGLKFGASGAGSVRLEAFNNMTSTGDTYVGPFGGASTPVEIKVKLNQNAMQVWLNDFSGAALFTTTAITEMDPGYVGFYNGSATGAGPENGNHTLVSWRSEFDSAFEVEISDVLPPEVSFVSSTEGTETDGTVRWQYVSGTTPMLYGDSIAMEIMASVDACADLINTGYANMIGQPENSIGAQHIAECGDPPVCEDPIAVLSYPITEMCPGGELAITATYNEDHEFTWYQDDEIANGGDVVDDSVFTVTAAGDYYAMVVTETCTTYTDTVSILITAPPVVDIPDTSVCDGDTLLLTSEEYAAYNWSTGATDQSASFTDAGEYYLTITDAAGCTDRDTFELTPFVTNEVSLTDTATCEGIAVTLDAGTDFLSLNWNNGATTATIETDTAGVFIVEAIDVNGCPSSDTAEVTLLSIPHFSILGTDTVCFGDESQITLSVDGGVGPFDLSYSDGITDYEVTDIDSGQSVTLVLIASASFDPIAVYGQHCEGVLDSSATITVSTPPDANLLGGIEICLGDSADLDLVIAGTAPFTVDYTDGTDTLTIEDVPTDFEWRVTPDATTTYQLVQVTDAAGCSAALDPSQTVEVKLSPSAEILGSATLCEGDTAALTFSVEGPSPFDIVYTDGTTEFTLTAIDSGYTVQVIPNDSTEYTLVSVVAEQGNEVCAGPVTGVADIDVIATPTGEISGDLAVCESDTAQLALALTGVGPFNLVYSDGTADYNVLGALDGDVIAVTPDTTTNYSLVAITDGSDQSCAGTVDGLAEVSIVQSPSADNITETCDDLTLDFVVTFDIIGGDEASYTVIGDAGTVTGSMFTSDPLVSETNYSFSVFDAAGCDTIVIEGFKKCDCRTNADTMDRAPLMVCEDLTGVAVHNVADTTNDGDDVLYYALHTGNGPNLGDVKAWSATPEFGFDPDSLLTGETYYISAVMGNDNGSGQPDVTDVCLSVAPGAPITFNPLPSASLTGAGSICSSNSTDLLITLEGNSPFDVAYSDGVDTLSLANITTNYALTVSPTTTTDYYLVGVSDNSDPTCIAPATDVVSIEVTEAPVADNTAVSCNGANTAFTVTIDITGGDLASYQVTGDGGTLTGAQFVSDEIDNGNAYTFLLKDDFACDSVVIADTHFCECTTAAGTMTSATPQILCEGELPNVGHNGDHVLDANDTLMYVLHNSPTGTIGEIFALSSTPVIGFNNAMEYGALYWISPIAGNIDAVTALDLAGDFCIASSPGTPVLFNQTPTAEISGGGTTCPGTGQTAAITFELTGVPPFDVVYRDQNGANFSLTGIDNGHVELLAPADTSIYTLVSVSDAGPAQCYGEVTGTAQINVPPSMDISTIVVEPSCYGLCNGTIATDIEGGAGNYSYSWRFATGDTIPGITGALLTGLCADNYIVDIVDESGCYASTQVEVSEPYPVQAILDSTITPSCPTTADGAIYVAATGGTDVYTFRWTNGDADATAQNVTAGEHMVVVTDVNGCADTLTVDLEVPGAVEVNAGDDAAICYQETYAINAVATGGQTPYNFEWEASPALSVLDAADPVASPVSTTSFVVQVTDGSGCQSVPDTIQVVVHDSVTVALTVGPDEICAGDSILISAVTTGGTDNLTVLLNNANQGDVRLITAFPSAITTYVITAEDECGFVATDSATAIVHQSPQPEIVISDSSATCDGAQFEFDAINTGNLADGSDCLWNFDNGDQYEGCIAAPVIFTTSGDYAVAVGLISDQGCIGGDTIIPPVNIPERPIADFTYLPLELDQFHSQANFDNQSINGATYDWTITDAFGSIVDQLSDEHPAYNFPDDAPGMYEVCLIAINSLGCASAPDCDSIEVAGNFALYIPTAFSPDGDGTNDFFYAKGIGVESYELLVYDRWGEIVFSTDQLGDFWDGMVAGSSTQAKSDVYTWKLTARSEYSDEVVNRTGRVTVVR